MKKTKRRVIKKIKLKRRDKITSRFAKLICGYKEYDTKFIKKPRGWKKWRDTQYKPIDKS